VDRQRVVSACPQRSHSDSCILVALYHYVKCCLSYISARLTSVHVSACVKVWLAPENSLSSLLYSSEHSE
jgi:hypothetical protein